MSKKNKNFQSKNGKLEKPKSSVDKIKSNSNKGDLIKGGRAEESVHVKTKRGRRKSSAAWLERQLNDPYVRQAKKEGYRGRAAYKLIELDEMFELIKPNMKIVDLGAAPGSWCQYIGKKTQHSCKVIGVDLKEVEATEGCYFIEGDFTDNETLEQIYNLTNNEQLDLVLSDMAPNTIGHAKTDHIRITYIVELAIDFAIRNLKDNGDFVSKVFQGGTEKEMLDMLKKYFKKVKHYKPKASRKESPETYVIAKGFIAQSRQNYCASL